MTELENWQKLEALYNEWKGKENYRVPAHTVTEMFNVHNYFYPQTPEWSKGCGGCRERVWRRLKEYYEGNKHRF